MNYLLTPPHMHYDLGFGISADEFKNAADILLKTKSSQDILLPINYLKRHAIELYLKSLIFILHKKFSHPFTNGGTLKRPFININGTDMLITKIHNLKYLYDYFITLHDKFKDKFPQRTDWNIPNEIMKKINIVSGYDPQSTYFRYPESTTPQQDAKKTRIQPLALDKIIEMSKNPNGPKVKCVLVYDDNDEIIQSFNLTANVLENVQVSLIDLCEFFSDLHVAYRVELAGGN